MINFGIRIKPNKVVKRNKVSQLQAPPKFNSTSTKEAIISQPTGLTEHRKSLKSCNISRVATVINEISVRFMVNYFNSQWIMKMLINN